MEIRLSAPDVGFHVDVELIRRGSRWVAVAHIAGEREIGLGSNAREALAASLSSVDRRAAAALLADSSLFGPSRAVL